MAALVVSGASGAGKTTVAHALGRQLGREVLDADDLHDPADVAQMASGRALTDAQRGPWLDRVAAWLRTHPSGVVACSALRRAHRDRLREGVVFVQLVATEAELRARVQARPAHFMPPALVPDQLLALEPLGDDERGVVVDSSGTLAQTVQAVLDALG